MSTHAHPAPRNPFNSRKSLSTRHGSYTYFDLGALTQQKIGDIARLPFSIRVLLEAMLRNVDGFVATTDDVVALANWNAKKPEQVEIPFMPGRVVLQDFTGVPCVVDLAAMRDAMKRLGGDPSAINPLVPCDLVIDHSVQVDAFGSATALTINAKHEFERNNERYEFLKWGQQSLANFSVVPPATGIVHQVNLEYLARGVWSREINGEMIAYPDSLVGTDSHTTMINGLGVLGWGVGGIEAEAVMLGQPVYLLTPEVIGFRLKGRLPEGATATDLVLTVTEMLRKRGVVDKFVEFFGPGVAALSVPDRATIANMAPEYGATIGFFPIDAVTLDFLRFTGRDEATVELVEKYCKAQGLFLTPESPEPIFTDVMELDLAAVVPSLAGPKRPQDRVSLGSVKSEFAKALSAPMGNAGFGLAPEKLGATGTVTCRSGKPRALAHGAVVIAAITSCTNTSNPDVMIAAGLVARKARALGLRQRSWVKTSLAPGSKVVTEYYDKAGLTADLEALGFHTVGYGCTTCIGNSGPLSEQIEAAIQEGDLVVASVLSGNRNFEGRVHQSVKANYLASPPLVVAYAIAGTITIDLTTEPIGVSKDGNPVFLKDIWPTHKEVQALKALCVTPEQFREQYAHVFDGNPTWNEVPVSNSELYPWKESSTYIQNPPFFENIGVTPAPLTNITGARCLVSVGDSVTTDHISPAGAIAEASPAGQYLLSRKVPRSEFNSYGSRRGNDRVMTRGTFANIRVKNRLTAEPCGSTNAAKEGWYTRDFSRAGGGKVATTYDASVNYKKEKTPLIVLAGKDYGMGSSRDWAAKGAMLLGVRAVIAESFERIHRSNLVGMGVLPLCYRAGENARSLGLTGSELYDIIVPGPLGPRCEVAVRATCAEGPDKGKVKEFAVVCRIDTPVEVTYYENGGILQTVLRKILKESRQHART